MDVCDTCCPHYCYMGQGDAMCTKSDPRMVREQWSWTGFARWCQISQKEKPLTCGNRESGADGLF